jgi:hypothetical protein
MIQTTIKYIQDNGTIHQKPNKKAALAIQVNIILNKIGTRELVKKNRQYLGVKIGRYLGRQHAKRQLLQP